MAYETMNIGGQIVGAPAVSPTPLKNSVGMSTNSNPYSGGLILNTGGVNSYVPPSTSSPVPTSTISNGSPLHLPPTPTPSNPSAFVNSVAPTPTPAAPTSQTPNLQMATASSGVPAGARKLVPSEYANLRTQNNVSAANFDQFFYKDAQGNIYLKANAASGSPAPTSTPPTPATPTPPMSETGDYSQDPAVKTAQEGLNTAQTNYGNALNATPSLADSTKAAYEAGGDNSVNADLKKVTDLNTQLAQLQAAFNNASAATETKGIESGTPAVFYQGEQAAIARQQAVQVGSKAIELQAAQGNYTMAKQLADQTVDMAFKDAQNKIDNTLAFVKLNQDNVSSAEKLAISKMEYQAKAAQSALDNQKSALSLQLNYPQAGITSKDTLVQATQKASAWLAANPHAGQTPIKTGSYTDADGNTHDILSFTNPDGSITSNYNPINGNQGNVNLGISVGTMFGVPTYNTTGNNPGLDRATANNNSGNIKATANSVKMPGVIGIDSKPAADGGYFLVFDTPAHSVDAIKSMITNPSSSNYGGKTTAAQAMSRYKNLDPSSGAAMAAKLGLDPNANFQKQLQDPTALDAFIQKLVPSEGKGSASDSTQQAQTYMQYGLLANTNFNPSNQRDKEAANYLDSYLKSTNGALPTAASLYGSARGNNAQKFVAAQDRAKELYTQATGASLPDISTLNATKKLVQDNNKVLNKNEILSDTITKNFDLAIKGEITNNVNKNATIVNKLLNPIYLALGDPAVNQALVSNGTISQEFANLISIRNQQGTTVADKEMANELIRFGTSVDAQKAVVERLKQEAKNIHSSLQQQNANLYKIIDPLEQSPNNPNRQQKISQQPVQLKDADLQALSSAEPGKFIQLPNGTFLLTLGGGQFADKISQDDFQRIQAAPVGSTITTDDGTRFKKTGPNQYQPL